jgi:hypothetical protein
MKKLILTAVLTAGAILSAGSALTRKAHVVAPSPVKRDIIICGNNYPPCMSDPSGDCSGCNTTE